VGGVGPHGRQNFFAHEIESNRDGYLLSGSRGKTGRGYCSAGRQMVGTDRLGPVKPALFKLQFRPEILGDDSAFSVLRKVLHVPVSR
jgi:hypothetical protein